MNLVNRVEHWGDAHHPKWLDILRVAFGIFLCFKGIQFLNNSGMMMSLMSSRMSSFGSFTLILISHYIIFAHLLGGFLLALGVLTRLACLIQIPILLGAVILINSSTEMLRPFSELVISVIVLVLLVYFLIVGNGPWSLYRLIDRGET